MQGVLFGLIIFFGVSTYVVGASQVFRGTYAPSVFSRVVWLLLAINSFAGVVASNSTQASIVLAGIFLIGNVVMCGMSFWKGTHEIGALEYICMGLLAISVSIWFLFDAPLVSLAVSLFAHFVGGLPTYRRAWLDPESESIAFWWLFFMASVLSVIASWGNPWTLIILPLYFTIFEGSMVMLTMRKPRVRGVDGVN